MVYVNRVNLQGYLEITAVEEVNVNSNAVPVMHGILHGGDFLSKHKLLITDYPASFTIEMVRRFQKIRSGQLMMELDDREVVVTINNGLPLVSVEGTLLSKPGQESVVKVRWIYFLSIPSQQLDFKDERLSQIVANITDSWWSKTETERKITYDYLNGFFGRRPR
jgi:hypothetical protein